MNTTDVEDVESLGETYKTIELFVLPFCACVLVSVNSLLIAAFLSDRRIRQRPANILICSQALVDSSIGLLYTPLYLLERQLAKLLNSYLIFYILFVSLFNLLALSVDRYLAIWRPLLHHHAISLSRTLRLLVILWSIPLLLSLLPICWEHESIAFKSKVNLWYLAISWTVMLVLVSMMTILYFLTAARARNAIIKKRQSVNRCCHILAKKEIRVLHLFGLLLFFFVIAYLPILYINLCDMVGKSEYAPLFLEKISVYSLILNSLVNPILCISLKHDYYKAVKKLFGSERGNNCVGERGNNCPRNQ